MENLFATSRELINRVSTAFVRDKHDEIDWNSRLISNVHATRTAQSAYRTVQSTYRTPQRGYRTRQSRYWIWDIGDGIWDF